MLPLNKAYVSHVSETCFRSRRPNRFHMFPQKSQKGEVHRKQREEKDKTCSSRVPAFSQALTPALKLTSNLGVAPKETAAQRRNSAHSHCRPQSGQRLGENQISMIPMHIPQRNAPRLPEVVQTPAATAARSRPPSSRSVGLSRRR